MSCGVGRRCGLNLVWLWRRLAVATPVQSLAWELPYATDAPPPAAPPPQKRPNVWYIVVESFAEFVHIQYVLSFKTMVIYHSG